MSRPAASTWVPARASRPRSPRSRATASRRSAPAAITHELSELCHRVLVFGEGTVHGELAGAELTPARIAERSQAAARRAPGSFR